MSILGKLMFWRKDEFADLDNGDLGKDFGGMNDVGKNDQLGMPGLSDFTNTGNMQDNTAMPQTMQAPSMQSMSRYDRPREIRSIDQPQVYPSAYPSAEPSNVSKDIELISVKLDTIRNTLEIMNQRIARIEKIAEGEQQDRRWV